MKISAILLILLPLVALGQRTERLGAVTQILRAQIDLAAGQLDDIQSGESARLDLQNGELLVQYQLPELGEEGRFYEVTPTIRLNGRALSLVPYEVFRGDWGQPLFPGERRLWWIDLPWHHIQLEGQLEIELNIVRWGERKLPYDCSLGEPQFTARQRRPYFLAAGLGVAGIGAGQIFRNQSQKIYDQDYSTATTLEEASLIYDDANGKHHTYLVLTYAGAGILAIDAALYLIRHRRYKRNREWYDQYCRENSTSLHPILDLSSEGTRNVGFKMTLAF